MYNVTQGLVGNKKKLQPNYIGPFEILDIFNDGQNYKIRELRHGAHPINTHRDHIAEWLPTKHKSPSQIALGTLRSRIETNNKSSRKDVFRMNQILGPANNPS